MYGGKLVPFVTVIRAAPCTDEEKSSGRRPITVRDRILVRRGTELGDISRGREGERERG